ncbi:hypothetical protein PMAYCL1PPCAC_25176, partial [Pristionchus mayeri]
SSKAIFLHRQPYYLLRSGLLYYGYQLYHFNEIVAPVEIDLAGVSLEHCLKVHHRNNLIVMRHDSSSKVERRSKNVI